MVQPAGINIAQAFRHVNFTTKTQFNNADITNKNDNDDVAFNGKMIATAWHRTSTVAVFNADQPRKFDANIALIAVN